MEKLTDRRSRDLQIMLNNIAYVQCIDDANNRCMPIIGRIPTVRGVAKVGHSGAHALPTLICAPPTKSSS